MEWFEIVDEHDRVVGRRLRSECHGNPAYVHRVAHVLVFNSDGKLILQKRSANKDIQPGRWDTSVGGHLDPGENYLQAAQREMREELSITDVVLKPLYPSQIRNEIESENIMTYLTVFDGEIHFDPYEIDEVKYWSNDEIVQNLGHDIFTPNFEQEWHMWTEWVAHNPDWLLPK